MNSDPPPARSTGYDRARSRSRGWGIQVHGAGGLSRDFPLTAAYAGIRTLGSAEGPDEMRKNALARAELRRQRETSGG